MTAGESTAGRCSRLLCGLTARAAVAVAVLSICGLLAAALIRMAPGFGMDERMLDSRLTSESLRAMERQAARSRAISRTITGITCGSCRAATWGTRFPRAVR
jgi:hypothetical protein